MISRRDIYILFTVSLVSHLSRCQDYDYEYDFVCDFYDSTNHECHHQNLPTESLKDIYNKNVVTCCDDGEYFFYDNCQTRSLTYGKHSCGSSDGLPKVSKQYKECPENCHEMKELKDFSISDDGSLKIPNLDPDLYVKSYCLSKSCINENVGWETVAIGCFCLNNSHPIRKKLDEVKPELQRCCSDGFLTVEEGNVLNCVSNEGIKTQSDLTCVENFLKTNYRYVKLTNFTIEFMRRGEWINIKESSKAYCIGATKNQIVDDLTAASSFFRNKLFYCQHKPCDGAIPCISTCCSQREILTNNHTCELPYTDNFTALADFASLDNHIFRFPKIDNAPSFEKRILTPCKKGEESMLLSKCYQSFVFRQSIENGTYLMTKYDGRKYYVNEYCLYYTEGQEFIGHICYELDDNAIFAYYPAILIGSSIFLAATLIIYTVYGKQLLNHYTRLMRHFTAGLFSAFLVLTCNKLIDWMHVSSFLCKLTGFIQQFSFLVAFVFMTLMSTEIFMKMKGLVGSQGEKRFLVQRTIGYAVPFLITLTTIVVEITAPECSKFRPRFGELRCFFTDKESKFLFFYCPIAIMLLINTLTFIGTIMTIIRVQRATKLYSKNQRETLDRFVLFFKLFLGMGIIWVFEIIADAASGLVPDEAFYFTNTLNMLQGIHVFIIFVCKKNVIMIILGKHDNTSGSGPPIKTPRWLNLNTRSKNSVMTSNTNLENSAQ